MHSICYSVDDRYAELAAVSMRSIEMFGGCPDAEFVVVGRKLSKSATSRIRESISRPVRIIDVDEAYHKKVKAFRVSNSHWSEVIFYRFYLADIINSKRILYLDADTLVRSKLADLLEIDMGNSMIAAVEEKQTPQHNALIGRPSNIPYLNSGVMLIDAGKWRDRNATEQLASLLKGADYPYPDQDAINLLVSGEFKSIDPRWNAGHWVSDVENAFIVHFTKAKPNNRRCSHPMTGAWRDVRMGTSWHDQPLQTSRTPLVRRLRNSIEKKFAWFRG